VIRGLEALRSGQGPMLLEVRVKKGGRANLGRPTASPAENKRELMRFLGVCTSA
jgi:phosphonopyruvate decarboxylase